MKNKLDDTALAVGSDWHETLLVSVFLWPAYVLVVTTCLVAIFLFMEGFFDNYLIDILYRMTSKGH